MKVTTNKIVSFLTALLLSFLFAACCLKIPAISQMLESHGNINMLTYAMQLVLFCLLFLVFYGVSCFLSRGTADPHATPAITSALLIFCAAILFFFYKMYYLEGLIYGGVSDRYIWHKLPVWLVLFCLGAVLIFSFLFIRKNTISLPKGSMYVLYAMFTVLIAYTFYTPAVFVRGIGDRLHGNAYFNSIYNVLQGSPYTEYATSIYGHYAIFYKLPLKLLGGDYIDFIRLNALLGALCFLAIFLALHWMVRNDLLRFLGCIALTFPVLSMRGGFYWQVWPHRILFMSLMLCFGAFCVHFRKLTPLTCFLGYVLSALAIVWNTESGLFCAIAWAGFWILMRLSAVRRLDLKTIAGCLLHLLSVVCCFAAAYMMVNLYNFSAGGGFNTLREFLIPLLSPVYMTDVLRVDLPDFPSAYIPVLALLFLAIAWGLTHIGIFRQDKSKSVVIPLVPCYSFFLAVLTLGQISYFMNRASYHNLDICHFSCVLLMCILSESGLEFVRSYKLRDNYKYTTGQLFQGAFTAISLGVLITLCLGNLVQYGFNADYKTQFHNKKDIHEFAAHIAAHIPEDTFAFGIGVAEIYAMLRWDTQCYTIDFGDISVIPQTADHITEEIRSRDLPGFLVGEETVKKLRRFSSDGNQWIEEHYVVSQRFEFQGAVFRYFTKRDAAGDVS